MAVRQVRLDANGEKILSEPIVGEPVATSGSPGVVQPDNATLKVDPFGVLSALGGNLLLNSEEWITESGEWTAPVTGWYDVLLISGGQGGSAYGTYGYFNAIGGNSGNYKSFMTFISQGDSVSVTIGAGGIGSNDPSSSVREGGTTIFGEVAADSATRFVGGMSQDSSTVNAEGGGFGGGRHGHEAVWYGGGGGADMNNSLQDSANGYQGAVRVRWHDPAKAAGPLE